MPWQSGIRGGSMARIYTTFSAPVSVVNWEITEGCTRNCLRATTTGVTIPHLRQAGSTGALGEDVTRSRTLLDRAGTASFSVILSLDCELGITELATSHHILNESGQTPCIGYSPSGP